MSQVYCTLYNSNYLDKGLVLYDSLCEFAKDFRLYVLCMDDKCYDVLYDLKQEHHIPIRICDFEEGDNELLSAKSNRSAGEYCWTCTPSLIRYVIRHYNEEICTYIDADMFFYTDPQVLIDEMLEAGKSVMLVPHGFTKRNIHLAKKVGTYCVEFNTFLNKTESLEALEYWRNRCLECCGNLSDGIHWGDQKYLDELKEKFDCVHVCQNKGAGVARWNIDSYRFFDNSNLEYKIVYSPTSEIIDLVFYHFQSIAYISDMVINTGVEIHKGVTDLQLVDFAYFPYLRAIHEKKEFLSKEYDINVLLKSHPSIKKAPLLQRLIRKFKPQTIYNVVVNRMMRGYRPYIICIN